MILQIPIPGGPELVIILLILVVNVLFLAVPAVTVVLLYHWLTDDGADAADVAELRERVAKLEARLADDRDDADR